MTRRRFAELTLLGGAAVLGGVSIFRGATAANAASDSMFKIAGALPSD